MPSPLISQSIAACEENIPGRVLQANKLFDRANQVAAESFSSIRVVAAFQLEDHLVKLFQKLLVVPSKATQKTAWASGLAFGFGQASIFFVYALAYW